MNPLLLIRSVLNWEGKVKSSLCFISFLLSVWFFQPWMLTAALLIPFLQALIFIP
jgi:hypothetical protein